jgi:hypothetical protein
LSSLRVELAHSNRTIEVLDEHMSLYTAPIRLADEVAVLLRTKVSPAIEYCARIAKDYRFVFLSVFNRLGEIQIRRMLLKQLQGLNTQTEYVIVSGSADETRPDLIRWPGSRVVIAVTFDTDLGHWLNMSRIQGSEPPLHWNSEYWEPTWREAYERELAIDKLIVVRVGAFTTEVAESLSKSREKGTEFRIIPVYQALKNVDERDTKVVERFRRLYRW